MSKRNLLKVSQNTKIGLALGSGSARGLAHIGVLRAMEAYNLKIDYIAGTSIGALIGAVYAAGNLDKLEATFKSFNWKTIASLIDLALPQSGLIEGKKIMELVQAHLPVSRIEALSIPMYIVTTDISTGKEVIVSEGNLHHAIRASIAIPGIFTPVCDNGRVLVDGGLVNPVPTNIVRAMGAEFVIAVDLNHETVRTQGTDLSTTHETSQEHIKKALDIKNQLTIKQLKKWLEPNASPNIFEIIVSSINIMRAKISEARLKIDKPELIIRPPLGDIHFLEFDQADKIISRGYDATYQALSTINQKLICRAP